MNQVKQLIPLFIICAVIFAGTRMKDRTSIKAVKAEASKKLIDRSEISDRENIVYIDTEKMRLYTIKYENGASHRYYLPIKLTIEN